MYLQQPHLRDTFCIILLPSPLKPSIFEVTISRHRSPSSSSNNRPSSLSHRYHFSLFFVIPFLQWLLLSLLPPPQPATVGNSREAANMPLTSLLLRHFLLLLRLLLPSCHHNSLHILLNLLFPTPAPLSMPSKTSIPSSNAHSESHTRDKLLAISPELFGFPPLPTNRFLLNLLLKIKRISSRTISKQ